MTMRHHGYTLTEILIATTILVLVMGLALETTIASRRYEASAAAQDDLAEDAQRILRTIGEDITLSGWHIPDGTTSTGTPAESQLETTAPDSGRLTSDPALDRERRYFPYVIASGTGTAPGGATAPRGNPTWFPYATVDASLQPDTAGYLAAGGMQPAPPHDIIAALGGTAAALPSVIAWYQDPTLPSQSLILLRAFTFYGNDELPAGSTATAAYESYLAAPGLPTLSFGANDDSDLTTWRSAGNGNALRVMPASPMVDTGTGGWAVRTGVDEDVAFGVPLNTGFAMFTSDGSLRLLPHWETIDTPIYQRPLDEDEYREYLYTVIRSPVGGSYGRLVRAVKARVASPPQPVGSGPGNAISQVGGTHCMVIDRVLSDHVLRAVFDTWRTDRLTTGDEGRLDINQVRLRLFLARPDLGRSGTPLVRQVSTVFTMRAKNTEAQRTDDSLLLGNTRIGFPR
jgi:prepilin-type N-terminal cleavage/methylation domain-containing protein